MKTGSCLYDEPRRPESTSMAPVGCAIVSTPVGAATKLGGLSPNDAVMDREHEAYREMFTGVVNQGDVFWLPADPSKGSLPGVAHPHVVVQDDLFNHSRISTVVVCALTSNLGRASEPGNVLLDAGEGDLARQSVVVVSQVASIYKHRLGERIGSLSAQRVAQILAGMRFLQASFFRLR
ncbi:type II toxin-antitoxin system PemK/MazF family toxin [Lysobacter gummosus]|uniref:Type II toxin-antitoxin system PemK/MazF family toxin n=1 Tax=Lysobacter gummosus TaxID=262324 RepID=A0ABY3XHF0_9GAMM|nr:type II toxin-antitoxin system PemK/MazF family toxin [Lysobacter gummosus]UNP31044.1 type II toxin-antitoxin system PemK/MazF family toxin [Lysobacter gummosus]